MCTACKLATLPAAVSAQCNWTIVRKLTKLAGVVCELVFVKYSIPVAVGHIIIGETDELLAVKIVAGYDRNGNNSVLERERGKKYNVAEKCC